MTKATHDLIEDALHLARAYKNGLVQKEPLEARRAWARDAAEALDLLAVALHDTLPRPITFDVDRIDGRNRLMRQARAGEIDQVPRLTFRYIALRK